LKSIFSSLAKDNRLIIIDKISLKEPKTKSLVQILSKLELENVLIIQKELENNLNLASRNIPNVDVVNLGQINPVNLISFDYVLMESKVLSDLERKLQ
jgi:large subunit ribosomal protein L4